MIINFDAWKKFKLIEMIEKIVPRHIKALNLVCVISIVVTIINRIIKEPKLIFVKMGKSASRTLLLLLINIGVFLSSLLSLAHHKISLVIKVMMIKP
jgi:hypothetical protein